jgi:hypothetical protein
MTSLLNNSRKPDISFNRTGRIDVSARIAHQLNLNAGDVIDIATHEREYYLHVKYSADSVVGRHEGTCYPTTRHGGSFRASSVRLCKAMIDASGINPDAQQLRLPCGAPETINDKIYIPIIIHNVL